MAAIKETPEEVLTLQGFKFDSCQKQVDHKDTNFSDNPIRQRLYEIFLTGERFSVVQLVLTFRIPDPRSHIRFIRNSGINISDSWVRTKFSRYKVYYMKGE